MKAKPVEKKEERRLQSCYDGTLRFPVAVVSDMGVALKLMPIGTGGHSASMATIIRGIVGEVSHWCFFPPIFVLNQQKAWRIRHRNRRYLFWCITWARTIASKSS